MVKRNTQYFLFTLMVILVLVLSIQTNAATQFTTGLESGQTQPTWSNTIDFSTNVTGYFSGINPECSNRTGEQAHVGTTALMFSGTDNNTTTSYCYFKVFDVNIAVTSTMQLSYWFYPQMELARHVVIDFICTDGSTLRDCGAVDQNGIGMHPGNPRGTINTWNQVQTNFGSKLNGKTIDRILVAYDYGPSTGTFHGYVDDITISDGGSSTPTPTPTVTGTPTPTPPPAGKNSKIVSTVYATDDIVISDYDVTDFGADKNGVNDSTSAIQNAINACYSSGGGTVWLPAGTYRVTNTIQVKAFVTLRGDWRDPDSGSGSYGTLVRAEVASGDSGPVLFRIGGSAGVVGITTYYPNQSATSPVHYNYTFQIPGRAWIGEENYMMSSVINCTMLNSYRGIGISTMASDHGGVPSSGQVHETSTVKNVKGTCLYRGAVAFNGAEVSTWEKIKFLNSYWANAGSTYNAPARATIDTWTRANGIGMEIGDLEWDHFYSITISNYSYGIRFVPGQRGTFCGEFLWTDIQNCNIAVCADANSMSSPNSFNSWGVSFLRSVLNGSQNSIINNSAGVVNVTDCTIGGSTTGNVRTFTPGTSPTGYTEKTSPKTSRAVLYDVTKSPYNAAYTSSTGTTLPTVDVTTAIQNALNAAGTAGGGVVYVPAGWYRVNTHLTVPANVELHGCSTVPQRDQTGRSSGTVLFAYEGHNTGSSDIATAFITLNGNTAGVRGLRVFYPNNNPKTGAVPYPYTIRGNGSNVYIVNIGLPNSYNAVDLATSQCDNHYVSKVVGTIIKYGIVVGASTEGWVEGVLTNGNMAARVGYNISGWPNNDTVDGTDVTAIINNYTKPNEKFIVIKGASNEHLLNCFAYGANAGLWVQSGTANMFNFGTDNVTTYGIQVSGGTVKVMNFMRYNGQTSTGSVTIYNNQIHPNSPQ